MTTAAELPWLLPVFAALLGLVWGSFVNVVIPLVSAAGDGNHIKGATCLLADLTEVVELRERLFLKEIRSAVPLPSPSARERSQRGVVR